MEFSQMNLEQVICSFWISASYIVPKLFCTYVAKKLFIWKFKEIFF